jgi:Protein of unknown function (DUF3096)
MAVIFRPGFRKRSKIEIHRGSNHSRRFEMALTAGHIAPLVALIAGILILIMPSLLNYIVAIYLIVVGLIGLNGIYHFIS